MRNIIIILLTGAMLTACQHDDKHLVRAIVIADNSLCEANPYPVETNIAYNNIRYDYERDPRAVKPFRVAAELVQKTAMSWL